jgi:hypothetical protein
MILVCIHVLGAEMSAGAMQVISRDEHGRFVGSGNPAGHVRSRQRREIAREWLDGIRARRKGEAAGPTLAEYVAGRKCAETGR